MIEGYFGVLCCRASAKVHASVSVTHIYNGKKQIRDDEVLPSSFVLIAINYS